MKRLIVQFDVSARDDLENIFLQVLRNTNEEVALRYIDRIEHFCRGLDQMPERFPAWRPSHSNLRVAVFERTLNVAYEVRDKSVLIVRVLSRGQDRDGELGAKDR